MTISKPVEPKQIAGKTAPKQTAGAGLTRAPAIPQKRYGQRYRILNKDKLMGDTEVVKIMKETDWACDYIDSSGTLLVQKTKTDLIIISFFDENDKEIPIGDLAISPAEEITPTEGPTFKVIWKKSLLKPIVELIKIVGENNYQCDIIHFDGTREKGITKSDFIVIGIEAPDPDEQMPPDEHLRVEKPAYMHGGWPRRPVIGEDDGIDYDDEADALGGYGV